MAVSPSSMFSYISYLNPWKILSVPSKIWEAVKWIFQREDRLQHQSDKPLVVYRGMPIDNNLEVEILVEEKRFRNLYELLDQTSRPYTIQNIVLANGTELEIAKNFLSDIARSGEPDQFFIDHKEITPLPKTEQQKVDLLAMLVEIADGDKGKVRNWTELWNYRLKINII